MIIPPGLSFADLELEREPVTKRLLYRPSVLQQIVDANDLQDQSIFKDEDLACWVVAEWYRAHRSAGGDPNPIAEEILGEVRH